MNQKFFKCSKCNNIIISINDSDMSVSCCGDVMNEIIPGSVDASKEKHIPQYEVNDNVVTVSIGSILHPMIQEHYIEWVVLKTQNSTLIKYLEPNQNPIVKFTLEDGDIIEAVYAYCNIHGLWEK